MHTSLIKNVLMFGFKRCSILERFVVKKLEAYTKGLCVELYTKIFSKDSKKTLYTHTSLIKWIPIQLQMNPFCVTINTRFKHITYDNSISKKVVFEDGKRLYYISNNEPSSDEFSFIAKDSHLLFIGKHNYSYLLKTMKVNFGINARELCMVTKNPLDTTVFLINSSFDEMIFKDTDSLIT